MGIIRHHAIVVTSYTKKTLTSARDRALGLDLSVSEIVDSPANGYVSFLVSPDGSNEGWSISNQGNEDRAHFIKYLRTRSDLDWVEVSYGDDSGLPSRIVSCDDVPEEPYTPK